MKLPFRVIYDEYGRTGNRFFAYLDSIGWAIQNHKKVIILFPENILKHFDNFRNSQYISLPLWNKKAIWWRLFRKMFLYNKVATSFYKTNLSHKLGFFAGWDDLRESHIYYPKVKKQIQELFVPNDYVRKPIDFLFSDVKRGKTIVGVHIRKEDYKTAYGGIYYYDDNVFIHYMNQMQKLIPNCCFYISSNEPISERFSEQFCILDKPVDSAVGDLYALSQCDYIIGPPSTFNCWASFIGDTPLYTMFKKDETINLDNFAIIRGDIK